MTFNVCLYDVINKEVVSTCSFVRGRSLVMFCSTLIMYESLTIVSHACCTRTRTVALFLGLSTVMIISLFFMSIKFVKLVYEVLRCVMINLLMID